MLTSRAELLFLVCVTAGVVANSGSYYKCQQGTYDCSCTPTNQETPYTNWKDCDHDCCPYFMCDSGAHQCRLDLAGGFSRASCAESCGIDKNGYSCEADSSGQFQCQPTLLSYQSKKSCQSVCGTNKVILCVYQCGESYYQKCKSGQPGETIQCWNQNPNSFEDVADNTPLNEPSNQCMADGASCLWAPCCGTSSCDANTKFCTSSSGPPTPIVLQCPNTGKPAKFIGQVSMQGLQQCMDYDCDWNAGPKKSCEGLANCPENAGAQACPTPSAVPRPASVEYMGISELAPPRKHLLQSSRGAVIKHTVNYTHQGTGKNFQATYNTKLTEKHEVVSVDQEEQVEALSCTKGAEGRMTLYLGTNSSAIATAQRKAFVERMRELPIVTASPVWKCLFNDYKSRNNTRTVALRKTRAVLFVASGYESVAISTVPSSYQDIFQEAHVSIQTTAFPDPVHFNEDSQHPLVREVHRQYTATMKKFHLDEKLENDKKVGGFFSFIGHLVSSAWKMVQRLAEAVAAAAAAIKAAVEAFVTGDVNYDKKISLASISYNYDKNSQSALKKNIALSDNVVCTECYSNLEVSLNFDFHMSNYAVQHVATWIQGDLAHHIEMTSMQQNTVKDLTFDKVMDILHFPDIHFMIGPVPVSITTTVPVHGGLTIEYSEAGSMHGHAHVTGTAKYGFQWTQEKKFQYIHEHSLSHEGSVMAESSLKAAVLVYVMPVIWINVDHIGGPNVGFKGFVEPGIDAESQGSQCSSSGGAGASYFVNFGLQLSIGAHIDIEFVGHTFINKTFEPAIIWSHKWPLASGCIDTQDQGGNFTSKSLTAQDQPYKMFDGVAYNGPVISKAIQGCDQTHSVHVSAQFVQTDDGQVLFGIGPNDNFVVNSTAALPYNVGCLGQTWYKMSYGNLAPYNAPSGSGSLDINYMNCTLDAFRNGYTYSQVGGAATFSTDLSTLTIDTASKCFEPIVLHRERKGALTDGYDIVWPSYAK